MLPMPIPTTLTFFLETILPGILGSLLVYPLLPSWARPSFGTVGTINFIGLAIILGFSPRLLQAVLVDFAMGRYWIPWMRVYGIRRLQRAIDKFEKEKVEQTPDMATKISRNLPHTYAKGKFLDAFIAQPDGHRLAACPTIVGNVVISFAMGLYVDATQGGNELGSDPLGAVVQSWLLLPKDARAEINEMIAVGNGLMRLFVIAGALALVYLVLILAVPSSALRFAAFAVMAALVAEIAYRVGVEETLYNWGMVRMVIRRQTSGRIFSELTYVQQGRYR